MKPGSGPDPTSGRLARDIKAVGLLDDPMRRKVYFAVPPAPTFTDRDLVSSALGISRNLAAFHLDKLAERGLLDVSYRRLSGKTGRGAGRPRKLYGRSPQEVSVSLPQRDYRLIAELFASALESAGRRSRDKLAAAAHERGVELGKATLAADPTKSRRRRVSAVLDTLVTHGYDPYMEGKNIYMRNCPFHALTRDHRDLVCAANHALMTGFVDTWESSGLRANYEPAENRCCVVLRPADRFLNTAQMA